MPEADIRPPTGMMIVVAALCTAVFVFAFTVPSLAVRAIESGRELSLPEQAFIARGNFWGRCGIFVNIALFVAAGVFSRATTRAEVGA